MMSNPKVYGYCDAGCRRRVPTYDEFKSTACKHKISPDGDGVYHLSIGSTYEIKNSNAVDSWGFTISMTKSGEQISGGQTTVKRDITLVAYDKYASGLRFSWLDVASGTVPNAFVVYELNGERTTLTGGALPSIGYAYSVDEFIVTGATEVYEINNDMTIEGLQGKSAYEIAVDNGFVGTEAEWLASLKSGNGNNDDNGTCGNGIKNITIVEVEHNG